ncbi:MAG: hypothetical protein R3C99_25845 [Pirellulaceae bacterium]
MGTGANDFTVSIDGGPAFQFTNVPNLTIDGQAGDDDIDIDVNALAINPLNIIGGLPSRGLGYGHHHGSQWHQQRQRHVDSELRGRRYPGDRHAVDQHHAGRTLDLRR